MQSALSLTAWMTSSLSLVVIARIASRSLTSARPRISSLVLMVGGPPGDVVRRSVSVGGQDGGDVEGIAERGDQVLPGTRGRQIDVDGAEEQEAEADGVAEPHHGLGVEGR